MTAKEIKQELLDVCNKAITNYLNSARGAKALGAQSRIVRHNGDQQLIQIAGKLADSPDELEFFMVRVKHVR